jgi:hypothetical protein
MRGDAQISFEHLGFHFDARSLASMLSGGELTFVRRATDDPIFCSSWLSWRERSSKYVFLASTGVGHLRGPPSQPAPACLT